MLTPKYEHQLLIEALAYTLNEIATAEHYDGSKNLRIMLHLLRRKISRESFEELVSEAKNRAKEKTFKQSVTTIHKAFLKKEILTKEHLHGREET